MKKTNSPRRSLSVAIPDGSDVEPAAAPHNAPLRVSHLQRLRLMLDELEVKLDARQCLTEHGRDRFARRIPVERDVTELLESLNNLIDSYFRDPVPARQMSAHSAATTSAGTSPAAQESDTVRIQLKLSSDLVRVLQAVRAQHRRASELVEEVLWSSTRVRDTAQLAGIRCPSGQAPAA